MKPRTINVLDQIPAFKCSHPCSRNGWTCRVYSRNMLSHNWACVLFPQGHCYVDRVGGSHICCPPRGRCCEDRCASSDVNRLSTLSTSCPHLRPPIFPHDEKWQ